MPALHRYLGNPVLSFIGRLFFRVKIGDFHCGLRGFRRDSMLALGLQATGMEFASEMVVKATLAGQRVVEVPTTLSPDGRSRPPHLRSWRDGWRHLRFLLLFSPRWLFLIPGIALLAIGLLIGVAVVPGPLTIGTVAFDVDTLVGASAMVVIGFQAVPVRAVHKDLCERRGLPGTAVQAVQAANDLHSGTRADRRRHPRFRRPDRPDRVLRAMACGKIWPPRLRRRAAGGSSVADSINTELPGGLRNFLPEHSWHTQDTAFGDLGP